MPDEEYDLMPHEEIKKLKQEIERLKKNPLGKGKSAKDLLDAVNNLNDSINSLMEVFKEASDSIEKEKKPDDNQDLKPLMDKLDKVVSQNKQIAEGIVSVADMIKKENSQISSFEKSMGPMKKPQGMPKPQMYNPNQQSGQQGGPNMPPPPGQNQQQGGNMPPPPNSMPDFPSKGAGQTPPGQNQQQGGNMPPPPSFKNMPPPPPHRNNKKK